MAHSAFHVSNPRRVAAGRRNQAKRRGLSPEGRERLRAAALRHKPWQHSTGPKTPAGKAQAALNGKKRQRGLLSVREIKADLEDYQALLTEMNESREMIMEVVTRFRNKG